MTSPFLSRIDETDPATVAMMNARLQAVKLRRLGLTYDGIAAVMTEYHGVTRAPGTWRDWCRRSGCPPSRGHGHTRAVS